MRTRRHLAALVAVVAALGLTLGLAPPAQSAQPDRAPRAATRIMPLGDSITGSPGCWRALLWQDLTRAGHVDVDLVGTLPGHGCGLAHDSEHEGHSGILATGIAHRNLLPAWLTASDPDVVLMHLGTNDVWSGVPTGNILAAYTTLVTQMREHNPAVRVLVAQLIPMDSARSCDACAAGVVALNEALPAWAASVTTPRSPVTVVDQWTGFDAAEDTYDGVHPNDAGNRKIADAWFEPVTQLLRAAG